MKTIWKFPLKMTGMQTVEMPLPAQILTVQPQGESVCAWAEVDPKSETVKVEIAMMGTGHTLPESALRYINTIQFGSLVFHFYEVTS